MPRIDEHGRRGISPLTTWHSQGGLLLISFTWGMSYVVPGDYRIAFSEVFPENLGSGPMPMPMWGWGLALIITALLAFASERLIRRFKTQAWLWHLGYGAHMVLSGIYAALAVAALLQAMSEIEGPWTSGSFWGNVVSAVSRTVLWGYIAYLHSTYARLPRPSGLEMKG